MVKGAKAVKGSEKMQEAPVAMDVAEDTKSKELPEILLEI